MNRRRVRPWYVGWNSLGLAALASVAFSFLVVNSLFFSPTHPSHNHWWYWPLMVGTIFLASSSIASVLWLIRDRVRARGAEHRAN